MQFFWAEQHTTERWKHDMVCDCTEKRSLNWVGQKTCWLLTANRTSGPDQDMGLFTIQYNLDCYIDFFVQLLFSILALVVSWWLLCLIHSFLPPELADILPQVQLTFVLELCWKKYSPLIEQANLFLSTRLIFFSVIPWMNIIFSFQLY